jgi:hypothetical protein
MKFDELEPGQILIDTIEHSATTGGYKIYLYFIKIKTEQLVTYNQYVISNGVAGKGFELPQYISFHLSYKTNPDEWKKYHSMAKEVDDRDCEFSVKAIFDVDA